MALKLSSVTDHGIGFIVLSLSCYPYENQWKLSYSKLRQFRPLDGALTSFLAGKFCTKKDQSHLSHYQQHSKRGVEKDGSNGLNKSQLFALCSMVENFAFTPFLYFLVVPEASLKVGVFKLIVSCA